VLFSPNIVTEIKSRRMRWVGYVARIAEKKDAFKIFLGNPEESKWKT
jgi:hypothetical protein